MAQTFQLTTVFLALALLVQSVTAAASDSAMSILHSTDDIKVGTAILAVAAVVVGLVMCVMGYRLFRYAVFVCGFIIGGILVASIIEWAFASHSWMETASWIGFFVGGIIVGVAAMVLYSLSIFIAGAAGGVLLAFALHSSVTYKISSSHPDVVLAVIAIVFAIICGVVALKLEKPVIIVATSFIGAYAATWGIGYFAGDFPNGADLNDSTPSAWWGYLACIIVLFVLGMAIQFKKTARNIHHKDKRHNHHHHNHSTFHSAHTPV